MKVTKLNYSPEIGNIYVVGEEGEPAIIIDFGYNNNDCLVNYVRKHHNGCLAILLTHGHFDHIAGLETLNKENSPLICVSEKEFDYLFDDSLNLGSSFFGKVLQIKEDLKFYKFEDEDILVFKYVDKENKDRKYKIRVIETPFHTSGSTCFYFEEDRLLFTGDTLFKLSIGRSDLKGSCPRFMVSSLSKLFSLPPETKIYPGHGETTSLEYEIKFNPYLRKI